MPLPDITYENCSNDYELLGYVIKDNTYTAKFKRKLITDDVCDFDLTHGNTKILWSHGLNG